MRVGPVRPRRVSGHAPHFRSPPDRSSGVVSPFWQVALIGLQCGAERQTAPPNQASRAVKNLCATRLDAEFTDAVRRSVRRSNECRPRWRDWDAFAGTLLANAFVASCGCRRLIVAGLAASGRGLLLQIPPNHPADLEWPFRVGRHPVGCHPRFQCRAVAAYRGGPQHPPRVVQQAILDHEVPVVLENDFVVWVAVPNTSHLGSLFAAVIKYFVELMMDNPAHGWGVPPYPVVDGAGAGVETRRKTS